MDKKIAIISGFGAGLSESMALKLLENDYIVIGLSRSHLHCEAFMSRHENGYAIQCDITDNVTVKAAFGYIHRQHGHASLLIHNAAQLLLDDFLDLRPDEFESLWRIFCLGAVNVSQQILPNMLKDGTGTLIFTGATASVKAGEKSAAFASAKFALRGLAQSLARAYGPQGIHVIHTIIDGVLWGDRAEDQFGLFENACINPNAVAETYWSLINQDKSAWTQEIDIRPYQETF